MTNIVIVVRGGIVSEVHSSDKNTKVSIIDWDEKECEAENERTEGQLIEDLQNSLMFEIA